MPIAISIVEDNDKLRGTLAKVIGRAEGFRFVSDYSNAEDALAGLPKVKPDVVLMDINLPGMNGVECVRKLKPLLPQTQVMMLTVYEDTENIFNALAAGANGYLLKRTPTKELIDAIREVQSRRLAHDHPHRPPGRAIVSEARARHPPPAAPAPATCPNCPNASSRCSTCSAQGLIYKEIADKLNIGYETVHTYIRRIYEKLQVRTRTEAVAKFLQR